jgi:hypothetical protein
MNFLERRAKAFLKTGSLSETASGSMREAIHRDLAAQNDGAEVLTLTFEEQSKLGAQGWVLFSENEVIKAPVTESDIPYIEQEYRVLKHLETRSLPVPKPTSLGQNVFFFGMSRVRGVELTKLVSSFSELKNGAEKTREQLASVASGIADFMKDFGAAFSKQEAESFLDGKHYGMSAVDPEETLKLFENPGLKQALANDWAETQLLMKEYASRTRFRKRVAFHSDLRQQNIFITPDQSKLLSVIDLGIISYGFPEVGLVLNPQLISPLESYLLSCICDQYSEKTGEHVELKDVFSAQIMKLVNRAAEFESAGDINSRNSYIKNVRSLLKELKGLPQKEIVHFTPISAGHDAIIGEEPFIKEIIPITLRDDAFPKLVVLRWGGIGSKPSPIQAMSYRDGQYVDTTSRTFFMEAGNTLAARSAVVADFGGMPGIFIADHGLDAAPFPGAQNTFLHSIGGQLTNATHRLPQTKGFSHDVSAGIIDNTGGTAIFISNIGERLQPPQLLMTDAAGYFTDVSNRLPASLSALAQARYTASALIDVTGSSRADLVLGTMDAMAGPSLIYFNEGNGDFSQGTPIELPPSPLSPTEGLNSSAPGGPTVLSIKPIHLSSSKYADLVVVSTNGNYTAWAVQLLINDGTGHFTDETTIRFGAPIRGTGGWVKQVHIADLTGNGAPDIITQPNIGPNILPSQVFYNNGNGHFVLNQTIDNGSVYGVTLINNQPTLLVSDGHTIKLETVNSLHTSEQPGPHRNPTTGVFSNKSVRVFDR